MPFKIHTHQQALGNWVSGITDAISNSVTGGFYDGVETADEYIPI